MDFRDPSDLGSPVCRRTQDMSDYVKPDETELKNGLTAVQFEVTLHEGTEEPVRNEYWDHKHAVIYVVVVWGEPLCISLDKYDSGTGWAGFTKPLEPANVSERTDFKLFLPRTE